MFVNVSLSNIGRLQFLSLCYCHFISISFAKCLYTCNLLFWPAVIVLNINAITIIIIFVEVYVVFEIFYCLILLTAVQSFRKQTRKHGHNHNITPLHMDIAATQTFKTDHTANSSLNLSFSYEIKVYHCLTG